MNPQPTRYKLVTLTIELFPYILARDRRIELLLYDRQSYVITFTLIPQMVFPSRVELES